MSRCASPSCVDFFLVGRDAPLPRLFRTDGARIHPGSSCLLDNKLKFQPHRYYQDSGRGNGHNSQVT